MSRRSPRGRPPALRRSLLVPFLFVLCLALGWWCFDLLGSGASLPPSNLKVRVLLSTRALGIRSTTTVSSADGLFVSLTDSDERQVAPGRRTTACELRAAGEEIAVPGMGQAALVVLEPAGGAPLEIGGRRYRGGLRVRSVEGLLSAVNVVPLESYLAGCIGAEMPASSSPLASLEAQAIASRTYAVHRTVNAPHFLYDDTRSQVYRGVDAEHPRVIEAVRATAGMVIRGRRDHFAAFYHSTCGGRTSHGLDVFGDEGREHRPVVCSACAGTRFHRWVLAVSTEEIANLAATLGIGNRLQRFEITRRDAAGRVEEVLVEGNRGRRTIGYGEIRSALRRTVGRSPRSSLWFAVRANATGGLAIEGGGFGHGVGLCQVGAMELGRQGLSSRAILQHYYPGTRLVSLP